MKKSRRTEAIMKSLCSQPGPEDGRDPRKDRTHHSAARPSRKTWQLCAQVQRALEYALSEGSADALLQSAYVRSVEPAPDATQLLVTVAVTEPASSEALQNTQAELERQRGRLRAAAAAAITRKKTPLLTFRIVPEISASSPEGEAP